MMLFLRALMFVPPLQEVVFEEAAPLVRSCADGYNVCIFAYGQTGSGKTFTMQGPAEQPGEGLDGEGRWQRHWLLGCPPSQPCCAF